MIILWIVIACAMWFFLSVGGLSELRRFAPKLAMFIMGPVPTVLFMSGILIFGPLVFMCLAGYLGLHGKLPGTGFRRDPPGFPVILAPQSGNVGE